MTTDPERRPSDVPTAPWWADPLSWVEVMALGNIAFMAVDIGLAHAVNAFANPAEWIPVAFSLAAPVVLLVGMVLGGIRPAQAGEGPGRRRFARGLGLAVGWGSIAVGVAGLLYHLNSAFFEEQTLKNLVYTAPFCAPLAYTGIGLLLILNRTVDARTVEWALWVVFLTLGGFVGNFALTLADHAQNGFFSPWEWAGVVASAWAVAACCGLMAAPDNRTMRALALAVMAVQMAVGLLGFALHVRADLASPMPDLWQKVLYGAPLFAPLLLNDIAILGVLAVWAVARVAPKPADVRAGTAGSTAPLAGPGG